MQTKSYPVLIRSECFLRLGAGRDCPTPEEIRTLMQIAELTGSKAATLTGLKDSRTVRRWVGGDTPIPFSA
ncbi:transcriptional regulator, partial [Escherichia coli]|nr:transcriptional regulator [Escherichia coli]